MQHCPYCGCDDLIKNGSTRGVPKWKCKKCGRQTSLKGDKVEKDRQRDQARSEAVLLDLSGLSLKAIAEGHRLFEVRCPIHDPAMGPPVCSSASGKAAAKSIWGDCDGDR